MQYGPKSANISRVTSFEVFQSQKSEKVSMELSNMKHTARILVCDLHFKGFVPN